MGIFKRGGVLYGQVKDVHGKWVKKSLGTADRVVARERYQELERREAIPSYKAANETTLGVAADEFVTSRKVKGCAAGTLHCYGVKLGHLERLMGSDLPLARLDATRVDKFIATRLQEGAKRNTIGKELTALRGLLKIAKRAGKFHRDLDEVLPTEWANDYEPRRTALTPKQVRKLVEHLVAPRAWTDTLGRQYERRDEGERMNHAAWVAFVVATGARLSEANRATRGQIDLGRRLVHFSISKTKKKGRAEKWVPVTKLTKPLLEQVIAAAEASGVGATETMFRPWRNVIRDLKTACAELGLPRVTPNDLRRTHANWLRDAGVDTASIADVLGHVDSRMVERVYGKLRPEQLRDRVSKAVGAGATTH